MIPAKLHRGLPSGSAVKTLLANAEDASWGLPWMMGPWEEQYWWHGGRDVATFGYGLEVPPNFQMGMPSAHFCMKGLGYSMFIFIVIYYFMCIFILTKYFFLII